MKKMSTLTFPSGDSYEIADKVARDAVYVGGGEAPDNAVLKFAPNGEEIEVPTWTEFEALVARVEALEAKI